MELENQSDRTLGKYGRMRRAFLEQNNPMLLNDLILTEKLFPHLWEIEDAANARMELLMKQYLEQNPAPDKETDQMGWVRHMNSLRAQAEEVVMTELINS
ncbi:TnpV protein [Flavonifractor plautii]|uniref:TnpV protein n=1 Tax=Flavonifractor plautii TaxID=292800 RepID=UPI002FE67EB2